MFFGPQTVTWVRRFWVGTSRAIVPHLSTYSGGMGYSSVCSTLAKASHL